MPDYIRYFFDRALSNASFRALVYRFYKTNAEPVLVLGNQKSGTSAIAVSLAHGMGKSATIDVLRFRQAHLIGLRNRSIAIRELIENEGKIEFSRDVIKDPNLTFVYDEIRHHFIDSQKLFIVRNPFANIRSILNRHSIPGNLDTLNLDQYPMSLEWKNIIYNDWLDINYTNYIDSLSKRWCRAVEIYLRNKSEFKLILYEDFLRGKEQTIFNAAEYLKTPIKHRLDEIVDVQQQSKGNSQICLKEFFGERNYNCILENCNCLSKLIGIELENW